MQLLLSARNEILGYGTKEMEECSCGGYESKCNFYPEKRKRKMATEKRLIDANTAHEELSTLTVIVTGLRAGKGVLNEYMKQYRESLLRIIDEQPTVDAVEVVRCKDCKHCARLSEHFPNDIFCSYLYTEVVCPNDFCSYGERRTDE